MTGDSLVLPLLGGAVMRRTMLVVVLAAAVLSVGTTPASAAKSPTAFTLVLRLVKAKLCNDAARAGANTTNCTDRKGGAVRVTTASSHAAVLAQVQAQDDQECGLLNSPSIPASKRTTAQVVGTNWWAESDPRSLPPRKIAKVLHGKVKRYKCPAAPQQASGSGDSVLNVTFPTDTPATAHFTYQGSSNFAVWAYNAAGEQTDLLVNTIGNYDGTKLINVQVGKEVTRLAITASGGSWTVGIVPLANAQRVAAPGHLDGSGDTVFLLVGKGDTAKFHATGSGNFAVSAYTSSASDLLVNEIAPYDGVVVVPTDTVVIEITADAPWSVDLT